jgi:hypothetical protein
VHTEQLRHVRKGCLERRRQDILSDGSRIEGSHKGWNSLQRTQPSGITILVALGHDFVLRRNVRIGYGGITRNSMQPDGTSTFLTSTHGSHHVGLVAAIATLHNEILNVKLVSNIKSLPELSDIHSNEAFGLTQSDHALTFGGMIDIKEELAEIEIDEVVPVTNSLSFDHDAAADLALQVTRPILEELHIDPSLLDQPWKAEARKSAELPVPLVPVLSSQPVESITTTKRKLELLIANEALESHLSPASELIESPVDVQTPPVKAPRPLVTKRARLGSDLDVAQSEATATLPPAHVASVASPRPPTGQLDHYFKTMARFPLTITPSNTLKPMSLHGVSAQPADTSLHATNSNDSLAMPFSTVDAMTTNPNTMAAATATATSSSATQMVCPQRAQRLTTASTEASLMLPRFCVDGLTRSQQLFSLTTSIDPRSLLIQGDGEFFLFMDMRAELKWISHEMTPRRWVEATAEYNKRMVTKRLGSGPSVVLKHPLALSRKLGELEPRLMSRILKADYKCKYYSGTGKNLLTGTRSSAKRNTEAFWKKHCEAISLVKPEVEAASKKVRLCHHLPVHPSRSRSPWRPKIGSQGTDLFPLPDDYVPWPGGLLAQPQEGVL